MATKKPETQLTVAEGKSVCFRAGIKVHGDEISLDWPEFKDNAKLKDEMLKNGTLVEVKVEAEQKAND
jgi:hypothetical protein